MTEQLLGLTGEQHAEIGQLVKGSRVSTRPRTTTASKDPHRYRGVARVMLIDDTDPVYSPKTPRQVALFEYAPDGQQVTVEMSGTNLEGDLALTIGGIEVHVACNATTAELRAALAAQAIPLKDCRATTFPGLWELDFNFGRWAKNGPEVTCEAYEPPPEDEDAAVYSGGVTVVEEGWVSTTEDADTYKTIEAVDWVPYSEGSVKSGAVGALEWHYQAGWIAMAWQCRSWSFAVPDPYGGET